MVDFYAFLWAAFVYTIATYCFILVRLSKQNQLAYEMIRRGSAQLNDSPNMKAEARARAKASAAERRLIFKVSHVSYRLPSTP